MSQGRRLMDLISQKSLLRLFVKFISGKKQLQRAQSLRKKIISMGLHVGIELVLASKAVPIYSPRIGDYSSDPILRSLRLNQTLFGWNLVSRGIKLLRPILGDKYFSDIIDHLLTQLIGSYEHFIDTAEKEGAPLDSCFGAKIVLGSTWSQLKNIHGTIGYGTRCNWFSKVFEEIGERCPLILLDVPNTTEPHGVEMMVESLNQAIAKLEEITGVTITNENLRKQIKKTNEIRINYQNIFRLWSRDKIKIYPLAFSILLCLLQLGFNDFLCDPNFFNHILKQLGQDLQKRSGSREYDTSSMPKFVLVNSIGGYDPHLPRLIDDLKGRLFVADAEIFKLLEPIETEGDILLNYARNFIKFESTWMDNNALAERYISVALKYNLDGIIFNNTYGCKSITPSLKLFNEKLQGSDLVFVDIGFQNIGDGYEQIKTRIGAIIEVLGL